MKNYEKPYIEEEVVEIEDIVAASLASSTETGVEVPFPFNTNSNE